MNGYGVVSTMAALSGSCPYRNEIVRLLLYVFLACSESLFLFYLE